MFAIPATGRPGVPTFELLHGELTFPTATGSRALNRTGRISHGNSWSPRGGPVLLESLSEPSLPRRPAGERGSKSSARTALRLRGGDDTVRSEVIYATGYYISLCPCRIRAEQTGLS
jgi:hypothetical protein